MGKTKNPELEPEQIVDNEPIIVKGPLRDDPEPAYVPAWEVVNDRQNILTDKLPPKIFSIEAMIAAGVLNAEALADYLSTNGYVTNTDYASGQTGGVVRVSAGNGSAVSSGILVGAVRSQEQYNTANTNTFICKGTLENVKADVSARGLVEIAQGQYAEPTAGNYTVKLAYDGTAWGVVITKDT